MSSQKYALFVACSDYDDDRIPTLRSPLPDAQRLGDALASPGIGDFNVTVADNPGLVAAQVAIHNTLSGAMEDDVVVLHLSGHGLTDAARRFYFVVPESNSDSLSATSLSGRFLREQLQDSRCQNIVLILDCCYAGAFGNDMLAKALRPGTGSSREFAGTCRALLTASTAAQQALEVLGPDGPTSVFTRALADGIETGEADFDNDGWIGLGELFRYASTVVCQRYPSQTPEMNLYGATNDILLTRAPVAAVVDLGADVKAALKSYHTDLRVAAAHVVGRSLRSTDPNRSAAARVLLKEVAATDYHPRVAELAAEYLRDVPERHRRRSTRVRKAPTTTPRGVRIDRAGFVAALYRAAHIAEGSADLGVLESVIVESDGDDTLWVCGTDRYRATITALEILGGGAKFRALIPAHEAPAVRAFDDVRVISIDGNGARLEVQSGTRLLPFEAPGDAATFPRLQILLPKIEPRGAVVQASELHEAVDRVAQTLEPHTPIVVTFGVRRGVLRLHGRDDDDRAAVEMRYSGHKPMSRVALNPSYLLDAVAEFQTQHVCVSAANSGAPVMFTSKTAPGRTHLVMPVRLHDEKH